jgi:hypothetical protein
LKKKENSGFRGVDRRKQTGIWTLYLAALDTILWPKFLKTLSHENFFSCKFVWEISSFKETSKKVKVKLALEETIKIERRSRGTAPLCL